MIFLRNTAIAALLFFIAALFLFAGALNRTVLAFPFVTVGNIRVSLETPLELQGSLQKGFEAFENSPLLFVFEGEVKEATPKELGLHFDLAATLTDVPLSYPQPPWKFFWNMVLPHDITPVFTMDRFQVVNTLQQKFSAVVLKKDASFSYDPKKKEISVDPERAGFVFQEETLFAALSQNAEKFGSTPIVLSGRIEEPVVFAKDLETIKGDLPNLLPKSIGIEAPDGLSGKWKINFPQRIASLSWEKHGDTFHPYFTDAAVNEFLHDGHLEEEIEKQAGKIKISTGENGKIVFDGKSNPGKHIERGLLRDSLDGALDQGNPGNPPSFVLPVTNVPPTVEISEDLQKLGIRELVGYGYTTFRGSPGNRIHNINVGVRHYDGTLIPPGATFSFTGNLGPVDASTGYKPELVIKPEGTVPEFGGGLCQVSTTMYRAALYSGLPIVERSPHTYAVTYYSQVGGHGIDATIYPGSKDLKYLNDTPGYLLIHSYADNISATFEFYGTKDGREVTLEGPYTQNRKGPPPEELIYTTDLPAGQRKVKEKPHEGLETTWYRYVKKGGETSKETIFSRYRAMPAKILVGGEGPAETDPTLEAARQFE